MSCGYSAGVRFLRDLWTLLQRRDFRRLFAVRLTSQLGDEDIVMRLKL